MKNTAIAVSKLLLGIAVLTIFLTLIMKFEDEKSHPVRFNVNKNVALGIFDEKGNQIGYWDQSSGEIQAVIVKVVNKEKK